MWLRCTYLAETQTVKSKTWHGTWDLDLLSSSFGLTVYVYFYFKYFLPLYDSDKGRVNWFEFVTWWVAFGHGVILDFAKGRWELWFYSILGGGRWAGTLLNVEWRGEFNSLFFAVGRYSHNNPDGLLNRLLARSVKWSSTSFRWESLTP
jgi:hypothetical protein